MAFSLGKLDNYSLHFTVTSVLFVTLNQLWISNELIETIFTNQLAGSFCFTCMGTIDT
jgi:hypothetical protein